MVSNMVKALKEDGLRVAVAASTGRAANHLGRHLGAMTLHRPTGMFFPVFL